MFIRRRCPHAPCNRKRVRLHLDRGCQRVGFLATRRHFRACCTELDAAWLSPNGAWRRANKRGWADSQIRDPVLRLDRVIVGGAGTPPVCRVQGGRPGFRQRLPSRNARCCPLELLKAPFADVWGRAGRLSRRDRFFFWGTPPVTPHSMRFPVRAPRARGGPKTLSENTRMALAERGLARLARCQASTKRFDASFSKVPAATPLICRLGGHALARLRKAAKSNRRTHPPIRSRGSKRLQGAQPPQPPTRPRGRNFCGSTDRRSMRVYSRNNCRKICGPGRAGRSRATLPTTHGR